MLEKTEIRKIFKQKRLLLNQFEVREKSQKICNNFIKNLLPILLQKKPNAKFSLYHPSYNEADTNEIVKYFIKNNIIFSYPKIIAKNSVLKFIKYEKQEFEKNIFYPQILEIKGEEILPDFLIIPLVCCDKNLNRIGMGAGFFDRTLYHFATINHKFQTIGLAYDEQLYNQGFARDEHDFRLDFIAFEDFILPQNIDFTG